MYNLSPVKSTKQLMFGLTFKSNRQSECYPTSIPETMESGLEEDNVHV